VLAADALAEGDQGGGLVLAIVGALLAGSVASWRIAQLRPADALSRVA